MKITISKFQELHQISMMQLDEVEKSILLVQCLTGKSTEQIEKMNPFTFNKLCKVVNDSFEKVNQKMSNDKPKNIVKVNGKYYWLNYDITKAPSNAGRYVEVATFSNDIIGNLHKILASMATPMVWSWKGLKLGKFDAVDHEAIANDFLHCDFTVAYHAAVFFWAVFSSSILDSSNYSELNEEQAAKVAQIHQDFKKRSAGYITAKWYQSLKI